MTSLAGTGTLVRMILRRDRVRMPVWVLAIALSVIGTAAALPESYPTAATRQARGELVDGPATRMILGPGFGVDDYTFGAMLHNEMFGMTAIALALMGIFTIVRHTRAEEESGRLELVRSAPVGRHAGLTAALIAVTGMNAVIALALILLLPRTIDTLSVEGASVFAIALALTGLVFAAVAAVMAQVNAFARAAIGSSTAVMGIAYIVRGFGDVSQNLLSWLSPFGWGMQTAPWVLNRWWPLLFSLATVAMLVPLAYAFSLHRDVGAGLVPPRPGAAHAAPALSAPLGTPVRLQRGSIIGRTVGIVLLGIGIGSLVPSVATMIEDNPTVKDMIEQMGASGSDFVESVLSVYISFFALVTSIFTVGAVVRLRAEEVSGRAENILVTPVSRARWAGEYLVVSVAVSTGILLLAGFGAGIMYAAAEGEMSDVWRVTGATLAYAPALWLTAGIALAVFGLAPRLIGLAWIVPVYAFAAAMLLPLLGLPDAALELSPFSHVPDALGPGFSFVPLLMLALLAAGCVALGLVAFRRRDVAM